jgi:hypothetical protein
LHMIDNRQPLVCLDSQGQQMAMVSRIIHQQA